MHISQSISSNVSPAWKRALKRNKGKMKHYSRTTVSNQSQNRHEKSRKASDCIRLAGDFEWRTRIDNSVTYILTLRIEALRRYQVVQVRHPKFFLLGVTELTVR